MAVEQRVCAICVRKSVQFVTRVWSLHSLPPRSETRCAFATLSAAALEGACQRRWPTESGWSCLPSWPPIFCFGVGQASRKQVWKPALRRRRRRVSKPFAHFRPLSSGAAFAAAESGFGARQSGMWHLWRAAGFRRRNAGFQTCFQVDFWGRVRANEKRLDMIPALAAPFLRWEWAGFKEQVWKPALRRRRCDVFQVIARIRDPVLRRRNFCCRWIWFPPWPPLFYVGIGQASRSRFGNPRYDGGATTCAETLRALRPCSFYPNPAPPGCVATLDAFPRMPAFVPGMGVRLASLRANFLRGGWFFRALSCVFSVACGRSGRFFVTFGAAVSSAP
jgi:hypothetical protein